MEFMNLCYLIRDRKVLLIKKKRGLAAGKINAPGGRFEKDETPEGATKREVREEVKVNINSLEFRGILEFVNNDKLHGLCHVFVSKDFEGEPQETEEATPMWVPMDELPWDKMWDDDRSWLPHVLEGNVVIGRFGFKNWKVKESQVWVAKSK